MNNDKCPGTPYTQRFKGIENFLRRIAFNLGNTPSQTEVKIISCIPIDVTDLQQRILTLEKELQEARTLANYKANTIMTSNITKNTPTRHSTPIVQTALGKPTPICSKSKNPLPTKFSQTNFPVTNQGCNTKSSTKKKSSVCFVSPKASEEICTNKYEVTYAESNVNVRKASVNREKPKVANKMVPKRLRRVLRKKAKQKTQLVYFAQTSNTPFNSYDMTSHHESINKIAVANKKSVISRTYLNNMIRKQYEPEVIADELTDISQFSSPICRDIDPNSSNYNSHESNLSCYYKKFENLDKCLPRKNQNFNITLNNNLVIDPGPVSLYNQKNLRNNHNGYYDSDYYDIFPVKEKSVKMKKEEILSKQFPRMHIEHWPENLRTKNNMHPFSYETANKTCDRRRDNSSKDDEQKYTISNAKRKKNRINGEREMNSGEPKICSVDYGNVYVKRNLITDSTQKPNLTTPCLKNTECLTVNTINTECQTVESKAIQHIPNDNKAEVTLNQIKNILQSVLTEVKTNIKSNNVVQKPKKDVVIQKDVSHNNIESGSTLLNSFTYNPSYSINPCLASYSRQVPNFCYANLPSLPMKCLQNYPLILSAKPQNCGCQHRGGDHKLESQIQTKPAATAATNTDGGPGKMQKKETINLIKEIYKSVAVDVNYSNKNTSRISFGYQKKTEQPEAQLVNTKEITSIEQQSAGKKNTELDVPTTILTSNITDNNTESIMESSQSEVKSELATTTTDESSQISDNYMEKDKVYYTLDQVENKNADQQSNNEETNASSSETESGDTLEADEETKKKVKPGLFQKVLQTVNIFKKRKPEKMADESESEESGSDYQTIYSYKTYKDLKQPITRTLLKPTTKQRHVKPMVQPDREIRKDVQENRRRSPYMEQEYRRYWDEKLMFHENQSPVHSSERSFPGLSRSPQSPVFWRGYEARSAILRHRQTKIHREHSKTSQTVQNERTGLKLEWLKKQKFKTPVSEES